MKLTPQHLKAVELLALGENNKSVAEKLEIVPETISRWRGDIGFQVAINMLLKESQQATRDRVRHLSTIALETIESIMLDSEAPHRDRLTASFKILELSKVAVDKVGATTEKALESQIAHEAWLESP